jgi:hypothetical protein
MATQLRIAVEWACRSRALPLIAVGLVLGFPTQSSAQSKLRPLVASTVAFSSDGVRYVAWQTTWEGPITALDTATGRSWNVSPRGCSLWREPSDSGFAAGDGRFMVSCLDSVDLLDARSGKLTPLPTEGEWFAVGDHYVEGNVSGCRQDASERRRRQPCIGLYDVGTGQLSSRPQSAAPDLDRAGAPPICPAIRRRYDEGRIWYSNGVLFLAGEKTAEILRCNGTARMIAISPHAVELQVRGGLISWDTGADASELDRPWQGLSGQLTAYRINGGRRYTFQLPRLAVPGVRGQVENESEPPKPGVYGYATHTSNTVFWVATRTVSPGETGVSVETSEIYAAKL